MMKDRTDYLFVTLEGLQQESRSFSYESRCQEYFQRGIHIYQLGSTFVAH